MNPTETSVTTISADDGMVSDKHFLFRFGQTWFSVPAVAVREVNLAPDLVLVPGCHPALEGLCRQKSEFIPVISLSALLDFEGGDNPAENNQLITLCDRSVWAMRIAEASALHDLETITGSEARYDDSFPTPVIGTAIFDDQVVQVLDPKAVHRLAQESLTQHWNDPHYSSSSTHPVTGATR